MVFNHVTVTALKALKTYIADEEIRNTRGMTIYLNDHGIHGLKVTDAACFGILYTMS
jgi:hypothetical protein